MKIVCIRLEDEMVEWAKQEAKKMGVAYTTYLRIILKKIKENR